MIKVINTVEGLEKLEEQWNSLYENISYKTPFQTFSFNYNSWSLLESSVPLHILCFYKQKLLQAIFPCVLTPRGRLQFINGIHSDFCGALILDEYRKDFFLYKELVDYIRDTEEIKSFMFDNLKEDNYLAPVLQYFFKGMQTRLSNKWSFFEIMGKKEKDESFIHGMPHISAKDRANMKRYVRQTTDMSLKFYKKENDQYPVEIVDGIVEDMLSTGIRVEAYFSKTFKELIHRLYDDNVLSVAVSSNDNEPLSANLYLIHGNEYIDWLAIYKSAHYNSMNIVQGIDYIYQNGGGIMNFARGIYDYKVSNFRPEIHNLYRIQYSKSFVGQCIDLLSVYKYYLKVMLKPIIRRK